MRRLVVQVVVVGGQVEQAVARVADKLPPASATYARPGSYTTTRPAGFGDTLDTDPLA
ncbi:MAG TPA: hypothetical protein VM121_00265 [Acidimicrobiales bacterium]|nr:hypothetical protein [Acidimicrobiales bacterium]